MMSLKGDKAMNAQFKKGVLELIVLESVRQKDMYGYELVILKHILGNPQRDRPENITISRRLASCTGTVWNVTGMNLIRRSVHSWRNRKEGEND